MSQDDKATPRTADGPTQEQIDAWRKKYGEILQLESEFINDDREDVHVNVICRKPTRQHFDRLLKDVTLKPAKAMLNIILDVILFPSTERFREIVERYPGVAASLGGELTEGMGFGAEVVRKKL